LDISLYDCVYEAGASAITVCKIKECYNRFSTLSLSSSLFLIQVDCMIDG